MKRLLSTAAVLSLSLGFVGLTGCSSNMWHHDSTAAADTPGINRGLAGGTGTMGEDPVHPGAYDTRSADGRTAGYEIK